MKSIRVISVSLLVFLFSVSTVYAFEVERRGNSIIITNQNPQIELTLSEKSGMLIFNLRTDSITLCLYKSVNEEEGRSFIRCTSNSTNKVVTFSDREYAVFSWLLANVDFSRWDETYNKFLYTALNLFQSWPSTVPVFAMMDPEKILYYRSDGTVGVLNQGSDAYDDSHYVCPDGKELNFPTPKAENLCFLKGELIEGDILYTGDWVYQEDTMDYKTEAWTESFEQYVGVEGTDDISGNDACFGRCGIGCPENFTGRITYTQRCFNHDGCVDECGYLAENCNDIFAGCMYDCLFAPVCYEIWVSTDNP